MTEEPVTTVPACSCHDVPMIWQKRRDYAAGGRWECRIVHNERNRANRAASPGTVWKGLPTVTCSLCQVAFVRLGVHLSTQHGITAKQYRDQTGLPTASPEHAAYTADVQVDRGLVAWTCDSIVAAFRRYARQHRGLPPSASTGDRSYGRVWQKGDPLRPLPTRRTVIKYFGSWAAAVIAADLPPVQRPVRKPQTRCAQGHRTIGRCLTCSRTYRREWARKQRAEQRASGYHRSQVRGDRSRVSAGRTATSGSDAPPVSRLAALSRRDKGHVPGTSRG